jgi:hypothetical protein
MIINLTSNAVGLFLFSTLLTTITTYIALKILSQTRNFGNVFFVEAIRGLFNTFVSPPLTSILVEYIPKTSIPAQILTAIISLLIYKFGFKLSLPLAVVLVIISTVIGFLATFLLGIIIANIPISF